MTTDHRQDTQCARASSNAGMAELRGDCPRWILNVLDAVSMSKQGKSRTALTNEILGNWAKEKLHEASLIQKLAGGNPNLPEAIGEGCDQ